MRALALAAVIGTHIERGALEEAQSTLSLATGDGWPGLAEHGRGLLLLAERNPEAALESFQAAGRRLCAWGVRNPTVVPWRSSAAVALLAVGDRRRARRLAESEVTDARAFGAPRAAGIALRALGLAEGGVVGLAVLERATAVLAHSGARLEHARALTELGATQRTLGLRVAARESLRAGLDLAYRCQASALVERSRGELRAVGLRPRRPSLSGNGALTPAERRVADLAADGLTNREIARTLFVSAKTIESHLASAYKKLGIHSRVQLARLLAHR
jgi:DNA-binding CsgD family transcriptional regulator